MESFIPTIIPPLYKETKNMFDEEIQELIIKSFSDATQCPMDSIKVSVGKADDKETITLQGTSTQQNGESTTTIMTIESLGKSTFKFYGKVESAIRNLAFNKTVICSSAPQNALPQTVRQVLAMSRVLKKKDPNLIHKIGNKVVGSLF